MTEEETRKLIIDSGGTAAVARACEVTSQAVSQWKKIPDVHCITLSKMSDKTVHEIRPDIFGNNPSDLVA